MNMCLLNILKKRNKKQTTPSDEAEISSQKRFSFGSRKKEEEEPDEEYQLPVLQPLRIPMNEDLLRRRREEALLRKYDMTPVKEGAFL